jgi:hypothetical protein
MEPAALVGCKTLQADQSGGMHLEAYHHLPLGVYVMFVIFYETIFWLRS